MKNLWKKISYIGIDQDMPDYKQKSIILLNRISFLIIIFFTLISVMSFKKLENPIVGYLFVSNVLVILITIFITRFKRATLSKFIVSIFIPISLIIGGAYAKSIGVTNNLILYLSPRMLLTITIIIPVLLFGYREIKKTIFAAAPGLIVAVLYDQIHLLFGIDFKDLQFESQYYGMFVVMIIMFILFVIMSILFLQNVNLKSEQKLQDTNNELTASEEELRQNNEEIKAINENLKNQHEIIKEQKIEIEASEKRFKNIAQLMPEIIFEANETGKLIYVNNRFFENTLYTPEDIENGIIYTDLFSKDTFTKIRRQIIILRKTKQLRNLEVEINRKDGTSFYALISINLHQNLYKGLIIDVTKNIQMKLEMEKLLTAVEQSANAVIITDTNGTIEYANQKASDLTSYTNDELIEHNPRVLKSGFHKQIFYKTLWNRIKIGKTWKGVFKNKKKNGKLYWEEATITPVKDKKGKVINFVAIKEDITKRRENRKKLNLAFRTIKQKNEHITQSINYAKLIQNAVLPSENILQNNFTDYFILNKPKDIVGGDFYYFYENQNETIIVAADCTGHGVPGGFMTMLGHAFLDEIISRKKISRTGQILDELRKNIIKSLNQKFNEKGAKDGMDMAICKINKDNLNAQYSGANNPVLIVNKDKTQYIKANKMPIGIYRKIKPFATHDLQLQKNDIIYMFSDGYQDQFGGEYYRKYMTKNFRNLLISNKDKPLDKQKEILENEFSNWLGNNSQIDDILVLAIKI